MRKIMTMHIESQLLPRLMAEYSCLTSAAEKLQWLAHLQAPLIETIDRDPDHCRVTFLFQHAAACRFTHEL